MKFRYDDVVDALYIELSEESPVAATEVSDGINVDTTPTGRIAGIEILNASSRIDLPRKDQNMAMTTPLPLRPILELFREHHTEALWMDYDEEADVLYINFQRPSPADHSQLDETDTIRRYQGDRLVGITILNASQRE